MGPSRFQFVHAADLHVDSPLRGLEYLDDAPVERLRNATRKAMENLVDVCIHQQAAFLIVAGDLFDGPWPDMRTGLWTARQFRRLQAAGIQVYLLRGNHDAASDVRQSIPWPDNVRDFSVAAPETFRDDRLGVALHGQGFAEAAVLADLAVHYPAALPGYFNIGVLHSSLTGDVEHDTYAPTHPETLAAKGYDYWALGHVHARQIIREHPWIAYSGNTQGRHVRECGPKGCLVVSVSDKSVEQVRFVPTDVVRWAQLRLPVQPETTLPALSQLVGEHLSRQHAQGEGKLLAVRIVVQGVCEAHWQLVNQGQRDEFDAQVRDMAARFQDVWIEHVIIDTAPPVDVSQLRRGHDLLGDLLRAVDVAQGDDEALDLLAAKLQPLNEKAALELRQIGIDLTNRQQLRAWLAQTESLLVGLLAEPLREM